MGNESSTPDVPQPTSLIEDHLLIWTDGSIDENDDHSQDTLSELRKIVKKVETCTKPEQCIKLLKEMSAEKVLVICSGSLGKELVPQIHNMSNIGGIYIFCGNEALHLEWTTSWSKIKLVSTKIESICDAMKKELIDSIPKKDPELLVEKKKDTPKEDTPKEDTPKEQILNPELLVKEDTSKEQMSNPDTTSQLKVLLEPTDLPSKSFSPSSVDTAESDSSCSDPNARANDNPNSGATIDGDDQSMC